MGFWSSHGNPLQFCLDYGVTPEDKVNSLAFIAAMLFCSLCFGVHSAQSRGFVDRFRLARGCATARERGFILPTEASTRVTCCPVCLQRKDILSE
jgi:hypothetical protein